MDEKARREALRALSGLDVDDSRATTLLRVAVPEIDPLRIWALFPDASGRYWRAPGGGEEAGVGIRARLPLDAARPGRLDPARRRLAETLRLVGRPAPDPDGIRLYGGAAFSGTARSAEWAAFGPGEVVLSEWSVERWNGETRLTLAVPTRVVASDPAEWAWRVGRLACVLREESGSPGHPRRRVALPAGGSFPTAAGDRTAWENCVLRAREAVRSGEIVKVVLARRSDVDLGERADPVAVLGGLREDAPDAFVFGFRMEGSAFVGASPERLFALRGREVRADALAGTRALARATPAPEGLVQAAEELWGSGKDLEEHTVVVRGLADALAPVARDRELPDWPEVRRAGGVAHLHAEVRAVLRDGVSAEDLLAALHPTPAVGGLPRDAARALIAALEPVERGWYAGPVGWISTAGDAEMAVAIRSALLRDRVAHVYAGAGIVAASDPAAEFRETAAKQQRVLAALTGRSGAGAEAGT